MEKISISDLTFNPFDALAKRWMLLASGDKEGADAMTVSWGHFGSIWGGFGEPSCVVYLRPQRYTREFIEKTGKFSLSSFDESFRKKLEYFGSKSGRDEDKLKKAGLVPSFLDGTPYFEEADLVFICEVLYADGLKEENFLDKSVVSENYPKKDFHRVYVGKIVDVLAKK